MEARRCNAGAHLVRAAPAAARLADVVCCAWVAARTTLVLPVRARPARRQTRSDRSSPDKSISNHAAPIHPGRFLSLSVHHHRRTSTEWSLVEAGGIGR